MNTMTELRAFRGTETNNREKAGWGPQICRLGITLALAVDSSASAQSYRVLKNFNGSDGWAPYGGLVWLGSTLYGTTYDGGSSGDGVVFKVNTDGSGYTVLKNFTGSDGAGPYAGVILAGGRLYGTTYNGGLSGFGVVFAVNADGSGYTVLKNFNGSGGRLPNTGLSLLGSTLYGTTCYSGGSGPGVVFAVNTDGSGYTVLKNFAGSDGACPYVGLVLTGSTLYGSTSGGGSSGDGVVFRVNTDGSGYTVLKNFTGSEGQSPQGDLALVGSTLYGTTSHGGSSGNGVVFAVNTDGSGYTVLKNFAGSDGAGPFGGVLWGNGTLYGTTERGGSPNCGVVFSLASPAFLAITTSPLTQTAETGSTPFFFVQVTNTSPNATYYQWYFSGTNALGGVTNSYLAVTNVQPVQAGAYTVVVTNLVGGVTSAPALLSVIPSVERRVVPALHLTGDPGSLLHLEYADSLVAAVPRWFSLSDVTLSGGRQFCFDLSQPLPTQRLYRAWQTNGTQPTLDASMATEIPLTGAIGSSVRVDYINRFGPTDAWVTLDTVTLTNTTQLYFDLGMFRQPVRLYRLVPVP